jgi:hypothetical protein
MEKVRKSLYWLGWAVLAVLPIVFGIQANMTQDLPKVEPWKWIIPFAAVVLIYAFRDRDEVFNHHVV